MPRIVDHAARRQELAAIAAELIAARGVEAATVREVAAAAGASTRVVSHYFADKQALLLATYRWAADDTAARADALAGQGDDALRTYLHALLPISPEMRRNWRVWFAFWSSAIANADFAADQRSQVSRAEANLATRMGGDVNEASRILTIVMGLALRASFDEARWPEAAQKRVIDDAVRG